MVIENSDHEHIRKAMWAFPTYMFFAQSVCLANSCGWIITFSGDTTMADYYVLSLLCWSIRNFWRSLFYWWIFSGRWMVMLESVASATMILNNLVMPIILRFNLKTADISVCCSISSACHCFSNFPGLFLLSHAGRNGSAGQHRPDLFYGGNTVCPFSSWRNLLERATQKGAAAGLLSGLSFVLYATGPTFVDVAGCQQTS